mmetsp:Transcript_24327/g.56076  ORF Transcript_24327/g.56076 Transcript_24327/m.56076 type:complete len:217 (-) Transcript_24327:1348-1998(-)
MHAENFRLWQQRQAVDEVNGRFPVTVGRHDELARARERVALLRRDALVVAFVEDREQRPPVPVVRHAAAVVALPAGVLQGLPWHLIVLVEEHRELASGDSQVGIVETVGDVPPQRAIESPLLDERMEEAEGVDQPAELLRLGAALVKVLVRDRVSLEATHNVRAQALRRLDCHLHAVLEHRDREHRRRVGGAPESEVVVGHTNREALGQPLEVIHP